MKEIKKPKQPTGHKLSFPPFFYYLIIIILLIIIYYSEIIIQKKFLWDDVLYQWYPFLTFAKDCYKILKLPVWNPYVFSGVPFLNDIAWGTFYPINLLFIFINGTRPLQFIQIELFMLFHLFLIGFFTFLLLKELKVDSTLSFYGAIVFMFSGYVSLRSIQISPINVFAWSIGIFYFFIRILSHQQISDVILGGFALGLAILGGHPQFILYLVYALVLYYIYYTIVLQRQNLIKWLRISLSKIILMFIIGLGISMVQYYPSFKYLPYTLREKMTYEQTVDGSLLPIQCLNIFVPKFFGSVSGDGTDTVPYWLAQFGHYYWESGIYIGILPFWFAILAIIFSTRKTKYIFMIVAILALLFAMGKYFPLYKFFWSIVPGLRLFRFPVRFLSIYTLSVGLLSVWGLEFFVGGGEKSLLKLKKFAKYLTYILVIMLFIYILFITGTLKDLSHYFNNTQIYKNCQKQFGLFFFYLFLTWLFFIVRTKTNVKPIFFILGACVISFLDLYQFGNKFSKSDRSPTDYYPYTKLVANLQKERQKEIFRIRTREDGYMILKRNEGCFWKLEALEGYTALNLQRYMTFKLPVPRWAELLNAKYLIHIDTINNRMGLIQNPKYLPRAFFCSDYRVIKDDDKILRLLANDSFDVSQIVILEEEPDGKLTGQKANAQVSIQNLEIDYIKVIVQTDQPGFLVLSEIYYPEWKARLDKNLTKIYRANYCLRAVYVPQGEHIIELYYDKHNIKIGGLMTFLTIVISIGIIIIPYRFK